MRKNGANWFRRLQALLLTLGLLLTVVPAQALEDWDGLSVGVTWMDAQGNTWTTPAWRIPEDQVSHGYWVTLDPQALGTILTLQIIHPDPGYTFWRNDWTTSMLWTAEMDAQSLDNAYADYIGYSYDGVPQVSQQQDCIKLYVSTQQPPFEVVPVETQPGEFFLPSEPGGSFAGMPAGPMVSEPVQAVIPVYYKHEDGTLLDMIEKTLGLGSHTLWPESQKVSSYELAGDMSATVNVYPEGSDVASVTFWYRDGYVAPKEATIDVLYVHENGTLLDQQQKTLGEGSHTLWAESGLVGNYELTSDAAVTVTVDGSGYTSTASVTFWYRDAYVAPVTGEVTVIYQLEGGRVIEQKIVALQQGENTLWPDSSKVAGLELVGNASASVYVDGGGAASPNPVVFTYREPAPQTADVVVSYYDTMGEEIVPRQTYQLPVGTHRVEAPAASDMPGYELISEAILMVTVNADGSYAPKGEELSFWYRPAQEETVAPVLPEIPVMADVVVYYFDTMGNEIASRQTVQLTSGMYEVRPEPSDMPEGYELISDAVLTLTVNADGSYAPHGEELSFWYRPVQKQTAEPVITDAPQKMASVTLRFLNDRGRLIRDDVILQLPDGVHTLRLSDHEIPAGYEMFPGTKGDTQVTVSSGRATPSTVTFYFKEAPVVPETFSVKVFYYDTMGKEIADATLLKLTAGAHTIAATPINLPSGYELASEASFTLTVNADGSMSRDAADVAFWYRPVQTSPKTGLVNVQYMDRSGKLIAGPFIYELEAGRTHTISPDANTIPDVYDPQTAAPIEVWIAADGKPTPATITFLLDLKVVETPIPVGEMIGRYGVVNDVDVAVRTEPSTDGGNKTVIRRMKRSSIIYMVQSEYGRDGKVWTQVIVDGRSGYMLNRYLDMMTQAESDAYALSIGATPVPTYTPVPTHTPEPTEGIVERITPAPTEPTPYMGYAVTIEGADLRTGMNSSDLAIIKSLSLGELVMVKGQVYDVYTASTWSIVQTLGGQTGYLQDSVLKPVSQQEAEWHIYLWQQQNATPAPTQLVTNTPEPEQQQGYGYTIVDYVPFRLMASEHSRIIDNLRVNTVIYITGQTFAGGVTWHNVAVNGEVGYLRSDLARLMTIAEEDAYLATLRATPTPTLSVTNQPFDENGLSSFGYVNTNSVNFREGPSKQAKLIRELRRYAFCTVLGSSYSGGVTWYKVSFNGREGYIHGDYFHQMTIREFNDFYGSDLYQQGVQNNRVTGNQTNQDDVGYTGTGGIISAEDQTVNNWYESGNEVYVSYAPFNPVATVAPIHPSEIPTLEPIPGVATATPTPTGNLVFGDGTGLGESSSDLPLPGSTVQVTYPTVEQGGDGGVGGLLIALALLLVAGGGTVLFVQYQRRRRKIAQRAAQRRAQQARNAAANRPYARQSAAQQIRTGSYVPQTQQPLNGYKPQSGFPQMPRSGYPQSGTPAQTNVPTATDASYGNDQQTWQTGDPFAPTQPYADVERPYARHAEPVSAPTNVNQNVKRVGRRTAYQQTLAEKQREQ